MSERVTTSVETSYYVRAQIGSGAGYLVERKRRSPLGKYYWNKNKSDVAYMTYNAAQKCAQRYGGVVVKRTVIASDRALV